MDSRENPYPTSCGFAAILGAPNAGKSTLTNALVGEHVSIVSSKVQTTRFPVQGVFAEGDAQIILVDTPGIYDAAARSFGEKMVKSALMSQKDADISLLVIDAARALRNKGDMKDAIRAVFAPDQKLWLIFNKIDLVNKSELLELSAKWNEIFDFEKTFFISAAKGEGLAQLRTSLAGAMPAGPWLFPEEDFTDLPLKLFTAERTREAAFERLHKELPYNLAVLTETIEERDELLVLKQVILIKNPKHKPIILGKGGQTIKAIGSIARRGLEKDLGCKVHLELFVKEKKNWDTDPQLLSAWRLDLT